VLKHKSKQLIKCWEAGFDFFTYKGLKIGIGKTLADLAFEKVYVYIVVLVRLLHCLRSNWCHLVKGRVSLGHTLKAAFHSEQTGNNDNLLL